jgi:hypothetical protein
VNNLRSQESEGKSQKCGIREPVPQRGLRPQPKTRFSLPRHGGSIEKMMWQFPPLSVVCCQSPVAENAWRDLPWHLAPGT